MCGSLPRALRSRATSGRRPIPRLPDERDRPGQLHVLGCVELALDLIEACGLDLAENLPEPVEVALLELDLGGLDVENLAIHLIRLARRQVRIGLLVREQDA